MHKLWNLFKLFFVLVVIVTITSSIFAIFTPHPAAARSATNLSDRPLTLPPINANRPAVSPPEVNIALFDDSAYVDTANNAFSESDNLQATLTQLGHTATTFSGITAADFTTALAGKQVLIIPELENGDLGADLSVAARGVISNFVASGGGVIIHGSHNTTNPPKPTNENHAPSFLNNVFGFSVVSNGSLPSESNPGQRTDSSLDPPASQDTTFYDDVAIIRNYDATQFLQVSSLPASSKSIYETAFGVDSSVALMPYQAGQVIFMGPDWSNMAPNGSNDAGWLDVLDSALHQLIPPNLEVQKRVSAPVAQAGQQIVYTITFSNAGGAGGGGAMLSNIVLTDIVPSQITNVTYSSSGTTITQSGGSTYVWTIADMTPGQRGTILITGTLDSSLNGNTIFTNTATIAGTNDNDSSNNQSEAAVLVSEIQIFLPIVIKESSGRN